MFAVSYFVRARVVVAIFVTRKMNKEQNARSNNRKTVFGKQERGKEENWTKAITSGVWVSFETQKRSQPLPPAGAPCVLPDVSANIAEKQDQVNNNCSKTLAIR